VVVIVCSFLCTNQPQHYHRLPAPPRPHRETHASRCLELRRPERCLQSRRGCAKLPGCAPSSTSSGSCSRGLWLAVAYAVAGLLLCITIIGIPFGVQSFKLAGYALWPFGRVLVPSPTRLKGLSVVANILWPTDLAQPPAGSIAVSGSQ
jgi:hypothetical protein